MALKAYLQGEEDDHRGMSNMLSRRRYSKYTGDSYKNPSDYSFDNVTWREVPLPGCLDAAINLDRPLVEEVEEMSERCRENR